MFDLEHPDITSALATGYPRTATHHTIECESCGAELAGEDDVFILEGQRLCCNCCKDAILDNYSIRELCDNLRIAYVHAEDCADGY